jgi:hypothetical protein
MRGLLGFTLVLALTACKEPAPPSSVQQVSIWLGGDADHLAEIVRFGDVWYTTNSNGVFSLVRLRPDGGLDPLLPQLDVDVRCTTADVHPASATLLCGNEYDGLLYTFSVANPELPVLTDAVLISDAEFVPISDIHVWGDEVWLAAYDAGLWRASIDDSGGFSPFELVAEPGNTRSVTHDGDRLVALVAERGVVVLEPEAGDGWTERGEVILDGPLLDLAIDDGRAAVAMGSAGAVTINLATLTPEAVVTPRAVVASVALRGDRLALGALSGMFVYTLGSEPRLLAFSRAGEPRTPRPGTMLDVAFEGDDELLVSDWSILHRYTLVEDGIITEVEAPTGIYRMPGQPITFTIRNHGDLEQEVEPRLFKRRFGKFPVAASTDTTITLDLDPARLAELFPPDSVRRIEMRRSTADGAELERVYVLVVTTASNHDPTVDGRPAPGMSFPPIQLARWERDPLTLPFTNRTLLTFFTEDCQAMWPQIQDMAWLARKGALDGGAQPVFVAHGPIDAGMIHDRFTARMRIEDVESGYYEYAGEAIDEFNHPLVPLYERGFAIERLESAAAHPTDYLIDDDGQVLAVAREYRGAHRLPDAP